MTNLKSLFQAHTYNSINISWSNILDELFASIYVIIFIAIIVFVITGVITGVIYYCHSRFRSRRVIRRNPNRHVDITWARVNIRPGIRPAHQRMVIYDTRDYTCTNLRLLYPRWAIVRIDFPWGTVIGLSTDCLRINNISSNLGWVYVNPESNSRIIIDIPKSLVITYASYYHGWVVTNALLPLRTSMSLHVIPGTAYSISANNMVATGGDIYM